MVVTCVDCGMSSPEMGGPYTLIGEEGWRPMHGERSAFDWRCPACWMMFKDAVGDALAPSANFIMAASGAPPDERVGDDEEEDRWDAVLAQTGERVSVGDACKDDTRPDSRSSLIAGKLQAVFEALCNLSPSARVLELHAHAVRCQSIVSMWRVVPADSRQQVAVLERLLRIQQRVAALASASARRSAALEGR
jgi:hypothetical protein